MDTLDKWFGRVMLATDIIFLLASMPHLAAWFAHFDHPTDAWSFWYAWGVGYGVAFAIDGVSFVLLLSMMRMIRQGKGKNGWTMFGLITFMAAIALLSWWINWMYDIQNATTAFASADAVDMFGLVHVGTLSPIVGGAFPVLILAYALISKAMQVEVKPLAALSDEAFAAQKKALKQQQELANLRKGRGVIGSLRDNALQLVEAGKEIKDRLGNGDELTQENAAENAPIPPEKAERNTGPLTRENAGESTGHFAGNGSGKAEESGEENERDSGEHLALDPESITLLTRYPKSREILTGSAPTVSIFEVAEAFGVTPILVRNRVESGQLTRTKNVEIVTTKSVVSWAKREMLSKKKAARKPAKKTRVRALENAG